MLLTFHSVHGSAITLSEDRTVATRCLEHFSNGIAFGAYPIKIGERICLELGCATEWSGAIRLGVTSHDPRTQRDLPKYACPDLTNKKGYWARAVNERYACTGSRVTFYINSSGQMQYFVNNEHRGVLLNKLPTDGALWVLLDVYGNTHTAKFIPPDEAPMEILARGPHAQQIYETACRSGNYPVFRTRLMLVGQDRVGKTSLKNSLTGKRHNTAETSTDGIDLSASCSFNLRDRSSVWKTAIKGDCDIDNSGTGSGESSSVNLEEEYNLAIANNIVQELLHRRKQAQPDTDMTKDKVKTTKAIKWPESKDKKKSTKTATSSTRSQSSDCSDTVSGDLLHEMPDRVVQLVQEMMDERSDSNSDQSVTKCDNKDKSEGRNINLNIWDFAGQAVYYTTHQVFLSVRAIYVIVFNLCLDLDDSINEADDELTNLEYMDFWMNSIHVHASQNTRNSVDNTTLSPPIFIVGTHRDSLSDDPDKIQELIEDKFDGIREMLRGKSYAAHVIPAFYAIDNHTDGKNEESELTKLRRHIEDVASHERYMGEQIPLKWLKMEQEIIQLVEKEVYWMSLDQMNQLAHDSGIVAQDELCTMLTFYHDLGQIIHYSGCTDTSLSNIVVLKPQWLVDMFKCLITAHHEPSTKKSLIDSFDKLAKTGILEEKLLEHVWKGFNSPKPSLISLMQKFDLLCSVRNKQKEETNTAKLYCVPSCLTRPTGAVDTRSNHDSDVVFYIDFKGFLPEGLFHRLVTRAVRWSQELGGSIPQLFYHSACFFLNSEHDFFLDMTSMKQAIVKVTIRRVVNADSDDTSDVEKDLHPDPMSCAKVRHFLDATLTDLREMWMKRITYSMCVQCMCGHTDLGQHFLSLDECLSHKIVCCEYRRVKTTQYRKWFPSPSVAAKIGPILSENILSDLGETYNIEAMKGDQMPPWVKGAAKLLTCGSEGQDWTALAKILGYKSSKIEKFNEDLNPGLALLTDWILSSGNTALSVDLIASSLETMHRDDIVEVIQKGQEAEQESPHVFISYQWDNQDNVTALRNKLESHGFSCWMDIGQMGGGDQLHARIDQGVRNCKVVIASITPKYIVSHLCNRELSLADLLRKPIIPVMFEEVSWPPPGGMSLMFSQLVYINMKGVGGHGGSGIHADINDKYKEIIQQVSNHAIPSKRKTPSHSDNTVNGTDVKSSESESLDTSDFQTLNPSLLDNVDQQSQIIPDYMIGRYTRTSTMPAANASVASNRRTPSNEVERVHVNKCAICLIL